jgi:hypothetical protein
MECSGGERLPESAKLPLGFREREPEMKNILFVGVAATMAQLASAQITGMTDASGAPLLNRLFANGGVSLSNVDSSSVAYVGQTSGGAQAGLFESLTLRGAQGTSQTLGQGIVLSSGLVTSLPAFNTSGSYSNVTNTGGNNYFRDFPAQTGSSRHGGRLQEHDENSITFDLWVPEGVQGLRADFVYASEEFPEWSGTQFADGFGFFVEGNNYARLSDGRPVSLLSESDNIHFMTNGDAFDSSVPSVADVEYDGLTRILELTAALQPGRYNEITVVVADTGDEIYDSAVFLSNFSWILGDAPLNPDDCHVRRRHRSGEDDSYIEYSSIPTPGSAALLMLGCVAAGRRRRGF